MREDDCKRYVCSAVGRQRGHSQERQDAKSALIGMWMEKDIETD